MNKTHKVGAYYHRYINDIYQLVKTGHISYDDETRRWFVTNSDVEPENFTSDDLHSRVNFANEFDFVPASLYEFVSSDGKADLIYLKWRKHLKSKDLEEQKLCAAGKKAAEQKYDKWSAYASGYGVQVCKGQKPDASGKTKKHWKESIDHQSDTPQLDSDESVTYGALKQMEHIISDLLGQDITNMQNLIENGHAWVLDHIVTAKEHLDDIYHFIMDTKGGHDEEDELNENLGQWFGEKWVRINTSGEITGDCGTMKDKKNPSRCLPKNKAYKLSKKERAATAQKKKREGKGKQYVPNTKKAKVKK
jgi:hypothetical protein